MTPLGILREAAEIGLAHTIEFANECGRKYGADSEIFRQALCDIERIEAALRLASADTHPKGRDVKQAPSLMSGAVAESETAQMTPNKRMKWEDSRGN